jgi:cell division protein ZipA
MDNFRWILLAAGIFFIVIIYLISRKNKRDFYQDDDKLSEELPDINTSKWDELDEGVGEVRIVARWNDDSRKVDDDSAQPFSGYQDEELPDALMAHEYEAVISPEPKPEPQAEFEPEPEPGPEPELVKEPVREPEPEADTEEVPAETVLILSILARDGSSLSGEAINSVAHANDMIFGEMDIFHRMDESNRSVFSLVNMVKPGSFDPSTIHQLNTPGITLFLQLPGPTNAVNAFDDMLHTAQRMSEVLEARLCDRSRQPLTESVVEEYRNIAASFDGNK